MDVSTDRRCKQKSGRHWQCSEMASGGSSYCERHHLMYMNRKRKRKKSWTSDIGWMINSGEQRSNAGKESIQITKSSKKQQHVSKKTYPTQASQMQHCGYEQIQKDWPSWQPQPWQPQPSVHEDAYHHAMNEPHGKEEVNDNKEEKGETCKGARSVRQGKRNTHATDSWHLGNGAPKMKFSDNSTKNKEKCLMCHQCQQNDKSDVVFCSNCTKSYCFECIERWYSEKTRQEVQNACPFCCGNCNCKACLRASLAGKASPKEVNANVELHRLQYLLYKALPVLKNILMEQNYELEIETRIQGGQFTAGEVKRFKLGDNERVNCDNCGTSIFNFHRSCPNASCIYDLCLNCCRELREGRQPGGDEAETSRQQFVERSNEEEKIIKQRRGSKRGIRGVAAANDSKVDSTCHFPDWRANADCSIFCPLKDCGMEKLELRCNLKIFWVEKLIKSAEELTSTFQLHEVDFSQQCSLCSPNGSEENSEVRQAAFRELSHDNCSCCPNVVDKGDDQIERFLMHWMNGEPVIVRNVLDKTFGLRWEPMVMWRGLRETGAQSKFKEETQSVKAIACLDLCQVEINLHQFYKEYLGGRMHKDKWSEMLKLKDWPSSTLFEEHLPRQETEIIEAATVFSQETEIIETATVVNEETEIVEAVTVVTEETEMIEGSTDVSQESEIIEAATIVTEVTTSISSDLPLTIIGPSVVTRANNPLADISLDDLVNNLDNYIDGYLLSPGISSPVINASDLHQFKEAGNHLTELLQLDASSLLLFENSRLAADFAAKLMYDPLLTDDERSKLTLIMDLPQMSSQWEKLALEENGVINFITSMEQKREDARNLKVDHLKSRDESHALQEDIKKVQTEMSSIKAQITLLQTQLADHEKLLVSKQKSLEEIEKDVDESGSKLRSTVTVLAINQDNIQLQKTRRLTINSAKKGILKVVKPLEKNCF